MRSFQHNRSGVIVTIIVIISFLFVIGFLSFFLLTAVQAVSLPTTAIANSFYGEDWVFHDILNLAETFMNNLWVFVPVIAVFGLAFWVYFDSQMRGRQF